MSTKGPDTPSGSNMATLSRKRSLLKGISKGGSRGMPSRSARSWIVSRTAESRSAKGSTFPREVLDCEGSQHLGGGDAAGRQSENNKVRRSRIERRAQLANLDALIDDEVEMAQGLAEKLANVVLAISDTDKRYGLSGLQLAHGPLPH